MVLYSAPQKPNPPGATAAEDEENPIYGTARVLLAYRDLGRMTSPEARSGIDWLLSNQDLGGGWGGGGKRLDTRRSLGESGVEETGLALEALLDDPRIETDRLLQHVAGKGLAWLVDAVEQNRHRRCSPIGLYFAKLWYYERLYPLIFSVSALATAVGRYLPGDVDREDSLPPPAYASHP